MSTFARIILAGSTNGRMIPVAATATPGTLIHSTPASGIDVIYLWVSNVTAVAATLTIEYGGVTDPGDHLVKGLSIPANSGPTQVCFGQVLQTALNIRAFSGTASALNISGYVNRIS